MTRSLDHRYIDVVFYTQGSYTCKTTHTWTLLKPHWVGGRAVSWLRSQRQRSVGERPPPHPTEAKEVTHSVFVTRHPRTLLLLLPCTLTLLQSNMATNTQIWKTVQWNNISNFNSESEDFDHKSGASPRWHDNMQCAGEADEVTLLMVWY